MTRAKVLKIGSFDVTDPVTELSLQTKGLFADSSIAGTIGDAVLKRFTVTLDYRRGVIVFEANKNFGQPDVYNRAGIVAHRERASGLVVGQVIPRSPAAKAGVVSGDVIASVDGIRADGFDLDTLQKTMRRDAGTSLHLQIQRHGKSRKVTLILRDLL